MVKMISLIVKYKNFAGFLRNYNTSGRIINDGQSTKFETVFSLPLIKYFAVINRLKLYHFIGTTIAVPGCGVLETLNFISEQSFLTASYIGLTGGIVLSIFTYPFKNIIGFLYISDDNKFIKISSVDFWGKRKEKIIHRDDWVPLMDITPKVTDVIYLTPQISDGTKYKLFVKFGKVFDSKRMAQILE